MLHMHGETTYLRIKEYHSWSRIHLISANENHLKSREVAVDSNSISVQIPLCLVQLKSSVQFIGQHFDYSQITLRI